MGAVLRFRLFGMPVTVQGSFLLIAALIGIIGVGDLSQTLAWIGVVFVSILIHELGHAFTARNFGSDVAIELNGLGGLTRWSVPPEDLTPGRRALIAASGSATGLLFGGLVWLVATQLEPGSGLTRFVVESLVYVNVFWGLLNWLPIRPLDGGHLLESLLEKLAPRRAPVIAKVIFVVTAAAALAFALWQDMIFFAVLAGWLLLSEFVDNRRPQPQSGGLPTLSYDDPQEAENTSADEQTPAQGESSSEQEETPGPHH